MVNFTHFIGNSSFCAAIRSFERTSTSTSFSKNLDIVRIAIKDGRTYRESTIKNSARIPRNAAASLPNLAARKLFIVVPMRKLFALVVAL